ncbi:Uncharacterised protein [Legionella beliardensis]|uniref:Uncharacterized protein n=1 Tax=Legionella beliardensis TaxID=91822 RepID=A0A378HZF2_9GAMM|nr:hypothetical protein [Legionella beliardensis]STX28318.1 Uncharacterised protein [Legionella beliardensis]
MWVKVILIFSLFSTSLGYTMDTEVKLYRPFGDVTAQEALVVKETYPGECWQQSERIKREDAWRCRVQNKIYDPCFVKQFSAHKQAICPQSPWNGASIMLNLVVPVNNSQHLSLDVSKTYPWAIELTTGEKCEASDAQGIYDNMPIRYHCNNQTELLGELQRCKTTWTILQRHKDNQITMASVIKAWF